MKIAGYILIAFAVFSGIAELTIGDMGLQKSAMVGGWVFRVAMVLFGLYLVRKSRNR